MKEQKMSLEPTLKKKKKARQHLLSGEEGAIVRGHTVRRSLPLYSLYYSKQSPKSSLI